MRRCKAVFIPVILVSVLGFCAPVQSQDAIQLLNPSFEVGDLAPLGWTVYGGAGFEWETEVVHSGQLSAKISHTLYRRVHLESDLIPLDPQQGYTWLTLSGWLNTEMSQGEIYLALAWYDVAGNRLALSRSDRLYIPPQEWTELSFSELAPEAAAFFSVWCASDYNPGTAWFDALTLNTTVLPRKRLPMVEMVGEDLRQGLVLNDILIPLPSAGGHQQFISDYPDHPLTVESLYRIERQKFQAARDLGQRKERSLSSEVLQRVFTQPPERNFLSVALAGDNAAVDWHLQRYETLIDEVLYQLAVNSASLADYALARQYNALIVERQMTPLFVFRAERNLRALTRSDF